MAKLLLFLIIVGVASAGWAHEQAFPDDPEWYCWVVDGDHPTVRCVQSEPANQADPSIADAWAMVRTESGAIDTVRMRQLVMANAATFSDYITVIPLWLYSQDMTRLTRLLDVAVCRGIPECRVALL